MAMYSSYTDQELVALMKQDSVQAMTELYNRYWHKLLAVAINRLSNLEEAEECVQDVFLKLWKIREQLELRYTLGTYLAAAVRYRVLDLLAQEHRKLQLSSQSLSDLEEVLPSDLAPDAHLLEQELLDSIERSVRQLPEKCRIVYRMSREAGLSNKQIAEELQVSEKAVEAHLTRAIKSIRGNLAIAMPIALLILK